MPTPDPPEQVPAIILCGGRGTRIADQYPSIPKPMVPIGGRPILWHVMKIYAAAGQHTFALALGWLGDEVRRFFLDYEALTSDFTLELGRRDSLEILNEHPDRGWRVTCVETGEATATGGRVKQAAALVEGPTVMVTYGDGVGDVDVAALLDFHRSHGRLATITAVPPPSRFGELLVDTKGVVREFAEKPQTSTGLINGGFMVFEREAIDRFVPDHDVMLEREPLSGLAAAGELVAYEHHGFWQPMDTARERALLDDLWASGRAPWKLWA